MTILFLYTRLADYFLESAKNLFLDNEHIKLIFIIKPSDKNAPYIFDEETKNLEIISVDKFKSKQDLFKFSRALKADIVYCSGWGDGVFRMVVKSYKSGGTPVVLGLDNLWKDSMLQKLKIGLLSKQIRKLFSHIWIPGFEQYFFARKLGFESNRILSSLYVGNLNKYLVVEDDINRKLEFYPKKIIYFGRLVEYKFVHGLISAFNNIELSSRKGWTLQIIGRGNLKDRLIVDAKEGIEFMDFMQPAQLASLVKSSGAYCLPSHLEHWGVAMHEAAAAGLPIISSNKVGASSSFCINGYNGFIFKSKNLNDLESQLRKLFCLDDQTLVEMGNRSRKLALKFDHETWKANLLSVLNE